jgi:2',3'-cyclic-nucleotide 2'-phosphodiesterase (5'-nucleotidase family)
VSVRLLHYSDLENVYDEPDRAARVAGTVESVRNDGGPDPLVLGSGDNTAPGVLSLVSAGQQALDLYREMRPDVETFGNHDFDYGPAATCEVVRASPQTWVSSNASLDGRRFGADSGVEPWTVIQRDGASVGVFGVLDDATPSLNPEAGALSVQDPITAARETVSALRAEDVDYVVGLSHLGRRDEALAAAVDVDAVLGGHIPTERIERIDGTLLTRPGAGGDVLLEITLPEAEVTRHEVATAPAVEVVAERLRERQAAAGLDEVVAHITEPIERTETRVFRGESRIGNFVADAYRHVAGTDVGLQNSGGVRNGPPLAGDVTVADLVSVVPFEERVSVAELTGEELVAVLEGADGADLGFAEPGWWHAHVSGMTVTWDDANGGLVAVTVGGEPVDPEDTYTLATTDYLFYTDDEFPKLDEAHRVRQLGIQYEVLAEYARERGIDPAIEGRITRREVDQ